MEAGRLAQGNKYGIAYTYTIEFVYETNVPQGETVTYAQLVCDHRPKKPEPYCDRCVVNGDKIECNINSGSLTTNIIEVKLLINSLISGAHNNASFMSFDIKVFSSNTNGQVQIFKDKYEHITR